MAVTDVIGSQERRDVMISALAYRGYRAASEKLAVDPEWEQHMAELLSTVNPPLADWEREAIFPWWGQS